MKIRNHKTMVYGLLIGLLFFMLVTIFVSRIYNSRHVDDKIQEEELEPVRIDYSKIDVISGKYYYEDDNFSSSFGIDVSEFQDEIDWQKVKNDKVEFVFIRIGRRGATTGLLYEDTKFQQNYEGAKNNGLKVGVYFFSQAINEKEAAEEADYVNKLLKGKPVDFPIVYDMEEVVLDEEVRTAKLTKEEFTANALAFLKRIEKHGHKGMIYAYPYWISNFYDMDKLQDYPLWYAHYDTDQPDLEYPMAIWQYSKKGSINGIEEDTDLNIMFIAKK